MAQASSFDEFQSNYDKVNRIDVDTWTKKKIYDESPYLVLPALKYHLKLGDTSEFKCSIMKLGEQFGDPIGLPGLEDYSITLKVMDFNYNVVCIGNMNVIDANTGQVGYVFSPLDFSNNGKYFFEIMLVGEDASFTLPGQSIRYEIIVRS